MCLCPNVFVFIKNKDLCSKRFPKDFVNNTEFDKNGFPKYKRKDNTEKGYVYNKKVDEKFVKLDNSIIVAYNSILLKKYKCHINVEYCFCPMMSIQYLFKYMHKGYDRAYVALNKCNKDK